MNVSYEGIGYLAASIPAGNCEAGQLCKLSAQGLAEKCNDGDAFCGFVEAVKQQLACVQVEGFVEVLYTGTAPLRGYTKLSSNGKGGVKADTAGKEYLVVDWDTEASKITIKL